MSTEWQTITHSNYRIGIVYMTDTLSHIYRYSDSSMEKSPYKMLRIKSIKYCYYNRDLHRDHEQSDQFTHNRGSLDFTLIGDDNVYSLKMALFNKDKILNMPTWDYSELDELYIEYNGALEDEYLYINVNHLIKLPITKLHLEGVKMTGEIPGAKIQGKADDKRYVWDNLLMYLPTLKALTIVDHDGILYALDLLYNPELRSATFCSMEVKEVRNYKKSYLDLTFNMCELNEDMMIELVKHTLAECTSNNRRFNLSIASEY